MEKNVKSPGPTESILTWNSVVIYVVGLMCHMQNKMPENVYLQLFANPYNA